MRGGVGVAGVTVIVVTYRSAADVAACLGSLASGLTGCGEVDLVVVDNDSDDDTVAAVRAAAPHARVVGAGRNAGYAAAINLGLAVRRLKGPVLVLNPDVVLHEGCGAALMAGLSQPGVGVAVPRLLEPDGSVAPSQRHAPTVRRAWAESLLGGSRAARLGRGEVVAAASGYDRAARPDWATGAAWLISEETLEKVGPWDEGFFLYSEETDYALRARDLGLATQYCPDAVASHRGGASNTDPDLYALMTLNRVRAMSKRHGASRGAAMRLALAVGELLRFRRDPQRHAAALRALVVGRALVPADARPTTGWVCFAAVDWWYHNHAHSELQLMQAVARFEPVLVVNSLGVRMPSRANADQPARRIVRKLRSMGRRLSHPLPDRPNLAVLTPFFLPVYGEGLMARLNAALVRVQVQRAASRLGMRRPAVLVTVPTAAPVVRRMHAGIVVFNRSDKHSELPGADRATISALEEGLLRTADHVVYVSHALMAQDRDLVGDRAIFLDHGVDLLHFVRRDAPRELQALPRPVVGFFGGIDDYTVDVDLLARLADGIEGTLLLIGDATTDISDLTKRPNVVWLGKRAYADIPALGSAFDVAIMPWLDNEWIRLCNPIKLKEYLALGLPVVSTPYPELDRTPAPVRTGSSPEEFVRQVQEALEAAGDADARNERRASVSMDSWDAKADLLRSLVSQGSH